MMLTKITNYIKEKCSETSGVFKLFIAAVLTQFALLNIVSIASNNYVKDIPGFESLISSSHLWWGVFGLFGAASLAFEKCIAGSKAVLVLGYISCISSFIILTFDYAKSKPIIHTGGILSVTAAVFLGGLLYGRIKHR